MNFRTPGFVLLLCLCGAGIVSGAVFTLDPFPGRFSASGGKVYESRAISFDWPADSVLETSSAFCAYRVWRSFHPSTDTTGFGGFMLLRQYMKKGTFFVIGDTLSWSFVGNLRAFVDPDSFWARKKIHIGGGDSTWVRVAVAGPHNGMPCYYAVTFTDALGTDHLVASHPRAVYAESPAKSDLQSVWVVPNPCRPDTPWNVGSQSKVQFVNLPQKATIKIYTPAGDHVRTLVHSSSTGGTTSWDLSNDSGRQVSSGIYLYLITTDAGEEIQGRFVIIR
ncbi:MAG: T9SS type A sorting domain-containing protein [Candidatus Eisenbacteria bacterium]|nr:T9SS type A sorting domain-containing protein [Candidatus Eisenbacteria bacterium]